MFTSDELKAMAEWDKETDRMSVAEINAELTPEQKAVVKKAKNVGHKNTVYKFEKKPRAENPVKREIINTLRAGWDNVEILNPEREFTFIKDNIKYKVTVSVPRKEK